MYAPPDIIETDVFASLPEALRLHGRKSAWIESRQHKSLGSFLEGPAFNQDGILYCTDIPFGRIFRIDSDGTMSVVAEYDGEPNGMKFHKDGRAFITDHKRGLLSLDLASGTVTPVLERAWGEGFRGLNDLIFHSNGDIYFTDQGQTGIQDPSGRLYRLSANGVLDCVLDKIPSPNGLAFNPDESMLYLNVTRANAVWRLPLDGVGHASKVGVFLNMSGGGGPDGVAVDEEGSLAVASPGTGSVWLFSSQGVPLYRIKCCTNGRPTNIAYGGEDNRTLFITDSYAGVVLSARMPSPGLRLYGQRSAPK
jgi:gluconolactonase